MFQKIVFLSLVAVATGKTIYDHKLEDINGKQVDFELYRGKTLLLVNVASQCGQTDSHYKALKRLYDILSYDNKFEILAFPCNDFGDQEPWESSEISEFVRGHFKAEFPLFKKVRIISGEGQEPLWKYVIETTGISPNWNFQKYLFDGNGKFVQSWDSNTNIEKIFSVVKDTIDNVTIEKVKEEL